MRMRYMRAPNAVIKGCNFHYNQFIFKKKNTRIRFTKGLLCDGLKSVKCLVQETGALAFMPVSEIMDKFDHIRFL